MQYESGRVIVFVVKHKESDKIYGICDTLGTAQDHIVKLSNLGFTDVNMMIEQYRIIEN